VADTVVGDLVARLRVDTTDFTGGLDDAGRKTGTFGQRVKAAEGPMAKLGAATGLTAAQLQHGLAAGAAIAGAAVVKFGADSVKAFERLANNVRLVQQATGATAETSSRFVAILDDYGVTGEQASRSLAKLGVNINHNTSALRAHNIEIARNKDGTVNLEKTFLNIADAYKNAADAGERNALVLDAFGRSGRDLIPILEQGRKGIREMFAEVPEGQILSQDDLDNARAYSLAMDNLSDAVQEVKISLGAELVPVVASATNVIAEQVRTLSEARREVLGFAGAVSGPLTRGLVGSIPIIGPGAGLMMDLGSAFGIGGKKADELTAASKRLADAQKDLAKKAADSSTSHKDLVAAQREYHSASVAIATVSERVDGAMTKVNKSLETQAERIAAATSKAQEYTNAQLGVEGAQLNVEAATNSYNESLFENGAQALATRQAAHNLEQQYVSLGKATYDAAITAGESQRDAANKQIFALGEVAGTLAPGSPLRVWLEQYIERLRSGIPRDVKTRVSVEEIYSPYTIPTEHPPTFAGGGVVPGPMGAPLMAVVHGGERIYDPLNPDPSMLPDGGGVTIGDVYIYSADMNDAAGHLVRRLRTAQFLGGM
jgi:hypothetical protein